MLHSHIALSTWTSLQHSRAGACLLQPRLRLPAERPLYSPFEQRLFTYLLKWKCVGLHFECDCSLLSHVERHLSQLLMLWCVPYSITKKRSEGSKKGCTCMDLHRSIQAAVLQYCSHRHTWQRINRCHPLILLHATHCKNTSLLFTTRISLLILNTSQPRVNPPMWHSHSSLHSPAWKSRSWGVLVGTEITNVEEADLEVYFNTVRVATAYPKSTQQLCCALEGHGKQGGYSAQMQTMKKHHLVFMWCYKLQ